MHVALLPPNLWHPLREQALGSLEDRYQNYATAIINIAHGRHLGLTWSLAASLPVVLLSHQPVPDDNPWVKVFQCMGKALEQQSPQGHKDLFGLVRQAHPSYVILRVILPLIQAACHSLGRSYLISEEPLHASVSSEEVQAYQSDLSKHLHALCDPQRKDLALFWQERALTLNNYSRGLNPHKGIPEADAAALATTLRLETQVHTKREQQRRLRHIASNRKQTRANHYREGGIDGIQLTRRPEDLGAILLSEFTNPDFILTDRLLNTGYFSLQRSPKRDMLRDVYVAAILPKPLAGTLTGTLLRACFFELCLHLAFLLRRSGMNDSCFTWIEAGSQHQLLGNSFQLKQLPQFQAIRETEPDKAWRAEFLTALGWIPDLLTPKQVATTELSPGLLRGSMAEQAMTWAYGAFQAAPKLHPQARRAKDYSFIHIMSFLPTETSAQHNEHHRQRGFQLDQKSGHSTSLTYAPTELQLRKGWRFQAQNRPPLILTDDQDMPAPRDLANRLVETWLQQFSKEIWRV